MMTPDQAKMMIDMFANPMFRQGAGEFFSKMQQDGMEAAKKFWGTTPYASNFPDAQQRMERMADFYSALGFVPLAKYEALQKETDDLRAENRLLRETIRELQQSFIAEGGAKAQQAWQGVIDKQMEMNREVAKSFFDAFSPFKTPK